MKKLKIAFLSYRSKPFSGGQGIYVKYLSKALHDLGHEVDVFSGPPYPDLDPKIKLIKIPSLGLYEKKSKFYDVELKKLLKSKDISEDEEKIYEKKVQTITDNHIKSVDDKVLLKEKEIMTI